MWLAWSSWRDARRGYQWRYSFCQSGEPRILEIHCRGMTAKDNRCCTAASQSYTLCDSNGGWLPRTMGAELRPPKATLCVIQMAESETCSCPDSLLSRGSWASDAGTELKCLIFLDVGFALNLILVVSFFSFLEEVFDLFFILKLRNCRLLKRCWIFYRDWTFKMLKF